MFGVHLAVGVVCCCECGCASGKLGVVRSMGLDRECLVMIIYVRVGFTGLWLGYNGLRYGSDQGIAKSPGKPWKMARLEIYGRRKNWVNFFLSL